MINFCIKTKNFFLLDYFNKTRSRKGISTKPFLFILFEFNIKYNFNLAYLFSAFYYIFAQPKLLSLLDCPPFARHYQHKGKAQAFFLAITFVAFYFSTFYTTLVDIISNGDSKWKQFSYEAALFIDFIYIILPFCVAHYAQLGTLKHLSQLSEQIAGTDNQNAHFIEKVKHSVKEMATINGTVHLLNSPPFAVYLFAIGADTLVNTCRMSVDPDFGYLIFSLIIFAYQLYLCTLTYRTKAVLGKIVQHCEDFEKRNSTETVTLEILKKNLKRKAPVQADSLLGQYESELSITVFRLFTINYRYIFLYSLFLLNHSVFLLQTKTEN